MGYLRIRDDAIWANHIDGDDRLRRRIMTLDEGGSVDLEIDGIAGRWVKMRTGKDGRATNGLRPVGPMREAWSKMQARRGEIVAIRQVEGGSMLRALRPLLEEWDTPEDDEAFRDLPLQ